MEKQGTEKAGWSGFWKGFKVILTELGLERTRGNRTETHKLAGLFHDDHAVAVIAQPHGGMSAGRAAAHNDDVPGDGLVAEAHTTRRGGPSGQERGREAHACSHPVAAHCLPRWKRPLRVRR
ncbi:hypothetical protein CTA1_5504 [Colletotrichum tanaceti]|uniref:Uncharacterized protein n=1 Tax=Colletotrichum tanaceti TaxID=1306861 RepID=A0A4U6XD39_9PEZI|nr:hypothetical protein CTA1_5504 [Colletotrichum tanaceti]